MCESESSVVIILDILREQFDMLFILRCHRGPTLAAFRTTETREATVLAMGTWTRSVMLSVISMAVEATPRTSSLSTWKRPGIAG